MLSIKVVYSGIKKMPKGSTQPIFAVKTIGKALIDCLDGVQLVENGKLFKFDLSTFAS